MRNLVLCRALSRDEMAAQRGLILLPQSAEDRQRYAQWVVVATGPDVMDETLSKGARVLIGQQRGVPVDIEGQPCMFVSEPNCKAIFEEE